MKTLFIIIVLLLVLGIVVFLFRCREKHAKGNIPLTHKPEGLVGVFYFSESSVGNTRTVAEWIAKETKGDLIEIVPKEAYPKAYFSTVKKAFIDRKNGLLPEILPLAKNPEDYDLIFLGAPIWFGTMAPPVLKFLEQHKLEGKIVIPFCSHGGGGVSHAFTDVQAALQSATIKEGFVARGSNQIERRMGVGVKSTTTEDDIIRWLNSL